jgi:carboxypeptidase family protein/TonB-dependent receptor-like protein
VSSVLFLALALVANGAQTASGRPPSGEIRGRVVDARGGEALARVAIQLEGETLETTTDARGEFILRDIPPGPHVLRVSTVGYRLARREFDLVAGAIQEFDIVLTPETLRRTETVEVQAGPYEAAPAENPSRLKLSGNELKNVSTVLADDPLRAVQSLPGVASNDDFTSRFSLRGADEDRVGLYLDGILLHAPFFTVEGQASSGSITAVNGDILDDVELQNGVIPAAYQDSTAGALDLRTREGSRAAPGLRVSASAASASAVGEGPLGRRGDWLASLRKSYLQYVIRRVSDDPSLAFGFLDGEGKVGYDLSRSHHLSLMLMDGLSNLDRSSFRSELGPFDILNGNARLSFADLAWRYAPSESILFTNRAAFIQERFINHNPNDVTLLSGLYGEWIWSGAGTWLWGGKNALDFGGSVRRIRNDSFVNSPVAGSTAGSGAVQTLDASRGEGTRAGAYAEQSYQAVSGRLFFAAGARWDEHSSDGIGTGSPQASVAFIARPSTRFHAAWGQAAQYPGVSQLFSRYGGESLRPERATEVDADFEQRLDERTRLRVAVYRRWDHDLLLRTFYQPAASGALPSPYPSSIDPVTNSGRGQSKGIEIFLERHSANRISGWVSYAYGLTRVHDAMTGLEFPSDEDQRHNANVYIGYRIRPTLNLGVKALYGSGFPIPGFYRRSGIQYFLSDSRNAVRLGSYQRVDFRLNKDFAFNRWKLSLYAEVINVLDRSNTRFNTLNGFNPQTRQAYLSFSQMIPTLPSAGVALQY